MRTENLICPVCEQTELTPTKAKESFCYKGHDFTLEDIEYSVCPHCQAEVITPLQSQRNEARIRDEHRKIDNLFSRSHTPVSLPLSKEIATQNENRNDETLRQETLAEL